MTWSPPTNHQWDETIQAICDELGVDPVLVKAHMAVESGFDPRAWNQADPNGGSVGLMQMSVGTASDLGFTSDGPTQADHDNLTDLFDPQTNIELAATLILSNLNRASTVDSAIAAYNEGWSTVYPGYAPRSSTSPDVYENQPYVDHVNAARAAYADDFPTSPNAGGASAGNNHGIVTIPVMIALLGLAGVALSVLLLWV